MGCFLGAALVFVAASQPPSVAWIARQLDSSDARTVAWGAYNAAAYHRDDLISHLQRILEAPPPTGPFEESALIGVVMDALIQLNASVAAPGLMPYIEKRPVHTFVLLSVATNRDRVLLDLLPRVSGSQWFAAADMLFADRVPELAAYVIETARLQLTVHVTDTAGDGFGSVNTVGGADHASGTGQDPADYPPHAEYRFELGPSAGAIVLATGPHPVYYSRTVTRGRQYAVSQTDTAGPTNEDRVAYLRAMSPDRGGNPFQAETDVTVPWSTPDALVLRVQQLRSDVQQRFRHLVDLGRRYYPVPAGLVAEPAIDVRLVDRRSDQTVPLPATWPVVK